jgi:hypothetical protein
VKISCRLDLRRRRLKERWAEGIVGKEQQWMEFPLSWQGIDSESDFLDAHTGGADEGIN